MSPRRTSGEDSILAMLEREPGRKRGAKAGGARLAWYGAGTAVALVLTGTLVWLAAANNGRKPDAEPAMMADAAKPAHRHPAPAGGDAAPPTPAAPAVRQVALAAGNDAALPQSARPAVIVDQAPPGDAVPPLRLLKPAPAPAVRVPVPAPAKAAAPVRAAPRTAAATKPAASRPAEARPAIRATPAPAPARARPVVVARSPAKPAPGKPQRTVNPARTGEPHVDADVALISAVIVHANGHAPEGSQMTELLCPNVSCKEKPPRQ
jgi:hypothetical protein